MAMLAAGRRPDLVRSLTLIEPPAFKLVRGNPVVEEFLSRMIPVYANAKTPTEFIRGFAGAFGSDYDAIKAAPFPKLVLSGDWFPAFEVACDAYAEAMGGVHEIFEGSAHAAHRTGERFNNRWLKLIGRG